MNVIKFKEKKVFANDIQFAELFTANQKVGIRFIKLIELNEEDFCVIFSKIKEINTFSQFEIFK